MPEAAAADQTSPPPDPQEAETQPHLGSNSETGQKTMTTASPGGASKRRRVARKRTMRRLQAQPTCRETCVSRCPREKRRLTPSLPPAKRRREAEARKRVPVKRPDRLHQPRHTPGLATKSFFSVFFVVQNNCFVKSMTPCWRNTITFHSSQQLPHIHLERALKGFLS